MQYEPCELIFGDGLVTSGHRKIGIPILGDIAKKTLSFILLQTVSSSCPAFGVITSFTAD